MILLDTHALVWWLGDQGRLSPRAEREIATAKCLYVSPISCWEVALLAKKGRLELSGSALDWVAGVMRIERVSVAELSPAAAAIAGSFDADDVPKDPADRLILATARTLSVPLVTKDRALRVSARRLGVRTIW